MLAALLLQYQLIYFKYLNMGDRNQKKTMKKTSIKTRANYSILSDELADDSADPTGPADHSDPGLEVAGDGGSLPSSGLTTG